MEERGWRIERIEEIESERDGLKRERRGSNCEKRIQSNCFRTSCG
jgi:hypothetical protein